MSAESWVPRALVLLVLVVCECIAHFGLDADRAASLGLPLLLLPVAAIALHTGIYVFLLFLFGRTLLPGRVPLITRLARQTHGTLAPQMEAYTRRATLAWCFFFAGQLLVSAGLMAFAPLSAWSLFVNLLNLPLLALMFALEHLYRVTVHPEFPHASIGMIIGSFLKEGARARGGESR
jgi:uncharacterized membrane protein